MLYENDDRKFITNDGAFVWYVVLILQRESC